MFSDIVKYWAFQQATAKVQIGVIDAMTLVTCKYNRKQLTPKPQLVNNLWNIASASAANDEAVPVPRHARSALLQTAFVTLVKHSIVQECTSSNTHHITASPRKNTTKAGAAVVWGWAQQILQYSENRKYSRRCCTQSTGV
jgi:hypothetical protein